MILLTLSRGKGEETVRLQLPASPAEIGEAFASLDRISLDTTATAILDVSSNVPVLYRCLYDVDVEDSEQFQKLQKLAERTEALSPAKAAIFSGALDAECVWNLEGALTVADRLDEYKRGRLKNTLAAAGLNMTPEEYTAFAMVKTGAVLLTVIPCLLIFPMLALIVVLLAVAVYFKEIRRAEEKLSAKRDEIEAELPRFVATITQELAASRDVLSMIEHYKQNSGPVFSAELDVLTADMRSGSYEAALTRFEARFNSPLLSDIVRGLIGVLRGDNGVHYFQMLSHDMKQLELQRLKAKAMKIPPKIRVFSFVLLMCFLVTYLSIIIYEIIHSLGGMF